MPSLHLVARVDLAPLAAARSQDAPAGFVAGVRLRRSLERFLHSPPSWPELPDREALEAAIARRRELHVHGFAASILLVGPLGPRPLLDLFEWLRSLSAALIEAMSRGEFAGGGLGLASADLEEALLEARWVQPGPAPFARMAVGEELSDWLGRPLEDAADRVLGREIDRAFVTDVEGRTFLDVLGPFLARRAPAAITPALVRRIRDVAAAPLARYVESRLPLWPLEGERR